MEVGTLEDVSDAALFHVNEQRERHRRCCNYLRYSDVNVITTLELRMQ